MSLVLNIAIGFLVLIDIILIVIAAIAYVQLKDCESKESVFCLEWICPNGERARRIHNGEVIESGPFGYIPPRSKEEEKKLNPDEVCS